MSFIFGFLAGAIVLGLLWCFDKKSIKLAWYEWLLAAIGIFSMIIAVGWGADAIAEGESQSALLFFGIFGAIALICAGIVFALYKSRSGNEA